MLMNCLVLIVSRFDQEQKPEMTDCEYNNDKGYVNFEISQISQLPLIKIILLFKVIYSAFGSFFIPMSIMLYVYSKIFYVLSSRQSRISRVEVRLIKIIATRFFFNFSLQACERAIEADNDFVTSEIDSSYPQSSKDIVLHHPQAQTTLYELLEYAKTRSILKNSQHSSASNSDHGSFVIRSLNTVQFNQNQPLNENSSVKAKKFPIRISSLKRETKTAQTLR